MCLQLFTTYVLYCVMVMTGDEEEEGNMIEWGSNMLSFLFVLVHCFYLIDFFCLVHLHF